MRELLPAVGAARTLTVCPLSRCMSAVNVSEQVDTVSPTGLTSRTVNEHGGHETGTVGRSVSATDESVSYSSSRLLTKFTYNTQHRAVSSVTAWLGAWSAGELDKLWMDRHRIWKIGTLRTREKVVEFCGCSVGQYVWLCISITFTPCCTRATQI